MQYGPKRPANAVKNTWAEKHNGLQSVIDWPSQIADLRIIRIIRTEHAAANIQRRAVKGLQEALLSSLLELCKLIYCISMYMCMFL